MHPSHPVNSPLPCLYSTAWYAQRPFTQFSMTVTCYDIIVGRHTLLHLFRRAFYSASTVYTPPQCHGKQSYLLFLPPSSPPPLAAWRSRRASLRRHTRREIVTRVVVTDMA